MLYCVQRAGSQRRGTDLVSASRRIVTICSSVNRVFLMAPSLLRRRHALKRPRVRKSPGVRRIKAMRVEHLVQPLVERMTARCWQLVRGNPQPRRQCAVRASPHRHAGSVVRGIDPVDPLTLTTGCYTPNALPRGTDVCTSSSECGPQGAVKLERPPEPPVPLILPSPWGPSSPGRKVSPSSQSHVVHSSLPVLATCPVHPHNKGFRLRAVSLC